MFCVFFILALISFSLFITIYGLYFLFVVKTNKRKEYLQLIEKILQGNLSLQELPSVSILVPTYNEEEVIARKLQNIGAFDYPREKMELILIDDCSSDNSVKIAQRMFNEFNLQGKIITKNQRMGVNASYNKGVEESSGDLILTTDADVMVDSDALLKGVKILRSLEDVGGITGKMVPVANDSSAAVVIEKSYRGFFDSMSTAESALHSTFPGYTCFMLLRKSAFSPLPVHYGSSDGNISLAIIRKGLKFLYVPSILFYEPIPIKAAEQRRQKIRRAARLIQSTLANKDMMFKDDYKSFGNRILPLRFSLMMIAPILFFVGFATMLLAIFQLSPFVTLSLLLVFFACMFLGVKTNVQILSVLSSFVIHQFYALMGLIFSQKKVTVWRPSERSEMVSTQ